MKVVFYDIRAETLGEAEQTIDSVIENRWKIEIVAAERTVEFGLEAEGAHHTKAVPKHYWKIEAEISE